jgi:hypothetical protein
MKNLFDVNIDVRLSLEFSLFSNLQFLNFEFLMKTIFLKRFLSKAKRELKTKIPIAGIYSNQL